MIEDRTPLEATGGVGGRKVDHNGIQAPLLPLERQILMEEEVTTPPRGVVRPLSLRVYHRGGGGGASGP